MLKFQDNHTTVIATFEDFILTVYVIIDNLYRQFAPPEVMHRRHVLDAKLSDPEIITIGICGELAGIVSENAWFCFEITPASTDDREGLRDIVEQQASLVVLDNKGYVGKALAEDMARQGKGTFSRPFYY